MRLRSIKLKDAARFSDSLTNALTGMGTNRDPRMANAYAMRIMDLSEVSAAYSGSGLMRKIINVPALDMVREWRGWSAESDQITLIENEEKRLGLRQKTRRAEVLRGLGGGAIIMGLPGEPSQLASPVTGLGKLAYLHVVDRWSITFRTLQNDATKPGFDEPEMWTIATTSGQVDIHPSRVVPFRCDPAPPAMMQSMHHKFWGESKVQQVLDAVQDCDTARQAFAALLNKARNVRIGIPDLLSAVASSEGEAAFQRRMSAFTMAESIFSATVYDTGRDGKNGETITDATYNFAGAKDMINAFCMFVSAVADIPQTRLFGTAPDGMNASGKGQQDDWHKMVRAKQTLELEPCLQRIDAHLVPSALGQAGAGIWSEFNPLEQESETEKTTRFNTFMDGVTKLQNTGTIPEVALVKGVQSYMIDEGTLPGLEAALDELSDDERFGIVADVPLDDPALPPINPKAPLPVAA